MPTPTTFNRIHENIESRKYVPDVPAPSPETHPIYPNGHVFNPSMPPNWNRKEWEKAKQKRGRAMSNYMASASKADKMFQDDCAEALGVEYDIPETQAQIVVRHAWNECGIMGKTAILNAVKDMGRLTAEILSSIEKVENTAGNDKTSKDMEEDA